MNGGGKSGSGRGGGQYRNPCLTMHQPWASLLIHGIKRIEGRSWPSPLTGRLWIHAASKVPEQETIKQMEEFYREIYSVDGVTDIKFPEHYPVSRLLGCVEIVGCLKKEEVGRWEEVPKSVRFEGLTEFCWLCEKPQKLIVPFEMRGYQGVYNLENKIYEAAVRGLIAMKGPLPVKFPLPNPQNSLSLKPGSLLLSNTKASEVEKSASVSAAIAGARAAATQFSRKDESRSAFKEQKHETTKNHATVDADRPNKTGYNLRKRSQDEKQELGTERKLTSAGTRDTISKQSETRILTPNGSTKEIDRAQTNIESSSRGKMSKNLMWSLKPEWITCLLQILGEYTDANMRNVQGFKDVVYQAVAQKLKDKFGTEVTADQCKNQIRHQQYVWSHIQELKKKSVVSWDESKKIILMGSEEYASHIQAFPRDASFVNIPISNYIELENVCGEGHATGEWVRSGNCQTPFRSQSINLDDNETSGFMETAADATQTNVLEAVDIKEEHTGTTKRAMPSFSRGGVPRKKKRSLSADVNLFDYIAMMADSVAKVANAIEGTSRAAEETKMFSQLMTELSSIDGFSEEEVDNIYDNLSKHPTMIRSFLSKPYESKARWMRKELGK